MVRRTRKKPDFATYKCYNCNRMGHIRSQCRIPVQVVHPTSRFGQGRGRANTRGRHITRRGQFGRNIGYERGSYNRSAFEISWEYWGWYSCLYLSIHLMLLSLSVDASLIVASLSSVPPSLIPFLKPCSKTRRARSPFPCSTRTSPFHFSFFFHLKHAGVLYGTYIVR